MCAMRVICWRRTCVPSLEVCLGQATTGKYVSHVHTPEQARYEDTLQSKHVLQQELQALRKEGVPPDTHGKANASRAHSSRMVAELLQKQESLQVGAGCVCWQHIPGTLPAMLATISPIMIFLTRAPLTLSSTSYNM